MRKDLRFDIDLTLEPRYTKEFIVKRKDSINLYIQLKNNGVPVCVDEQIPRLYVRKPNGTVVVQGGTEELGDKTVILDGYTVIVELKNTALDTTGLCYAELELEDERGTLITQTFIFEVVDRLTNAEEAIKAVNDIYLLGEIEKFIIQAKIDMAIIKEEIQKANDKALELGEFVVRKSEELENAITVALSEIDEKVANAKYELDVKSTECSEYIRALGEEYKIGIGQIGESYLLNIAIKADEVLASIREQQEIALEDIENKREESLLEIVTVGDEKVHLITTTSETEKNAINTLSNSIKEELDGLKRDAIENISSEKNSAINEMETLKEEALDDIDKEALNKTTEITDTANRHLEEMGTVKDNYIEEIGQAVYLFYKNSFQTPQSYDDSFHLL